MRLNARPIGRSGYIIGVVGFGRRFVAYLIDSVILGILGALLGFVLGLTVAFAVGPNPEAERLLVASNTVIGLLISAVYYVTFWTTADGQTPGKMLMDIKVIGTDGSPVGLTRAMLRFFGYILSSAVLSLGFALIAFDRRRRGWHDRIADTIVVRRQTYFSHHEPVVFEPQEAIDSRLLVAILYLGGCGIISGLMLLFVATAPTLIEELATPR